MLKELYEIHPRVEELAYKNHTLLGILKKYTKFGGSSGVFPVRVSLPQGLSADFSTAQNNAISSEYARFLLTMTRQYGVANVDGLTGELSIGDSKAFMEGLTAEIDGAMRNVAREMNKALYRTRTGSLTTAGTVLTTTITMPTASLTSDIHLFELNMELVFSASDGGALRGSGASATVTALDRDAGTLTSDSNWATQVTGLVAGDYIYREGDNAAAGSSDLKCAGLADWLPSSAPGATAFYNVDRSLDPTRLAGTRYDGSTDPSTEEALINGQSKSAEVGEGVTHIFMNNANYRDLITALGSKVRYDTAYVGMNSGKYSAQLAFRAVCIEGDYGPIKVLTDRDCPINVAYGLRLEDWLLVSVGNAPKIIMRDGLRIQRGATTDSDQVRIASYYNLACVAPVNSVRIALA
jgi:hypothetical protein